MDRIELGRQVAADRHDAAVQAGSDPWNPLAFALAEAQRLNIATEPTASNAASLNGARAVFVPDASLILYARDGSEFDRAFLIAHELGHRCLGDSEGNVAELLEIDPARSAEASPTGMARVVDYSRRERREVQMDLFARELLLPRHWVRRLHVEDRMSAGAIAQRLGAPFEVVAQQLLDALLLPIVDIAAEESVERPLNEEQAEAAQHAGCPYLLEAGPGTGKTRTLVGRIEHLLEQGVDPRKILVLTFSNKAAGEIAERIARSSPEAATAIWTGTFHSFGLDLIRRFHDQLKVPADPWLLDRVEATELLENEFPRLDLSHYRDIYDPTDIISNILTAISRAKDEVVDALAYTVLANRMGNVASTAEEHEAAEKAMEVAKVYQAYERLKRQAGALDFGDLVSLPVLMLEEHESVRHTLRTTYEHVLVDEYQDVNRSSVRLLAALCGDARNLWVVGDAKQSIYRFRGASSFNLDRFGREDFPGGKRFRLRKNYRSVPEVLNICAAFAKQMIVADGDVSLEPERASAGRASELRRVKTGPDEVVAIADAVGEMRQAGYRFGDQAVLCTGNERLSKLGHQLEALGIPVLFLGNLFERPEVKDLLAVLSLLVDRRVTGLLRTARTDAFSMTLDDVARVIDHLRQVDAQPGDWHTLGASVPGLSPDGAEAISKLDQALAGFSAESRPWEVVATFLLDRTRTAAELATAPSLAERSKGISIWQLMNFLRVQPAGRGLPITRLLDRVRRLVRLRDDHDLRQLPAAAQRLDAVRLMTMHGAKGLEFAIVHLPGMNVGTLPKSSRSPACPPPVGMVAGAIDDVLGNHKKEHDKEQECLFYVALSRARDRLFLYAASVNAGGAKRDVSPFIKRLGNALSVVPTKPSREPHGDLSDTPIDVVVPDDFRLEGHGIGLYQACPRRFFYTHLLQIGGKRTQTAFMQMHDAVRTVYQLAVKTGESNPDWVSAALKEAFAASSLAEHGYVKDYRALATKMMGFFTSIRMGQPPHEPVTLTLWVNGAQVSVTPDDVFVSPEGEQIFRRVQTRQTRKDETKNPGAIAFLAAARQVSPQARVEFIYLSDENVVPVDVTDKQFASGSTKVNDMVSQVHAGLFPAEPSDRSCPGCPAFFVCGELPPGRLLVGR